MEIKQILLTTDFSANARSAYSWAMELCRIAGARLHLTHFAGVLPPVVEDAYEVPFYNKLEKALAEEARTQFGDFQVVPHLRKVRWTPEQLRSLERDLEIDLVVMATHGRTGVDRFMLGSFAERVVANSIAPVFVYRQSNRLAVIEPRMVVVPFDFSDAAGAALPMIRYLNATFRCLFRFVYAYEPEPAAHYPIIDEVRAFFRSTPTRKLEERFAKIATDQLAGVNVAFEVCEGVPTEVLVSRAQLLNADVIVLGTHGVLGSVAQTITRSATCSVLVVPHADSHAG